jgi:glycosyltransferase involved in cell wall biosynthesis
VVTGEVPDMAAELREGDIFVASMVSGGGISNKVLEAMSCGLPVVTTPLVANNFINRPEAIWVTPTSRETASAIDTLAGDRELRLRMGRQASEFICSGGWSWHARTDRLIQILGRACGADGFAAGIG